MSSADSPASLDTLTDVLATIRKKGVRLWSENGQLRYRAAKGVLTPAEIESLRTSKGQIVALLEGVAAAETVEARLLPRSQRDRAPLSFSQQAHWNLHCLGQRRSTRIVAAATQLRGSLNVTALSMSLTEIVRRHEALRTRIVVVDGVPTQHIVESVDWVLETADLTGLPDGQHEAEVKRRIETQMFESIDVCADSLFAALLLRVRDDEHVLVLTMEHMISDGFSLGILLRDLFTAYFQILQGRAVSLRPIPVQFADYAVWQRNEQLFSIEERSARWNEHLAACRQLTFPVDHLPASSRRGAGRIPLPIDRDLKAELLEWCRLRQTTLVMSVFTAYIALVLRWCNASEAVIQYQTDGRFSPKVQDTVGYFAFRLYLRIELREEDSFISLLSRATEEYCNAYEHADFSHTEAKIPRPEFTRTTCFNWLAQDSKSGRLPLAGIEDSIDISRLPFEKRVLEDFEMDSELMVGMREGTDVVRGVVQFPLNRFSFESMEKFGRNLLVFVRALLSRPEQRVKDIPLL